MTDTFAGFWLSGLRERWSEIDVLIAEGYLTQRPKAREAFLRSAVVLTVAHFEGDLKGILKCVIDDGNLFSLHKDISRSTRRSYCRFLMGVVEGDGGKEANEREERLMAILAESNAKIENAPFIGGTSNPSPDTVRKLFLMQGVKTPFSAISKSSVDDLFEGGRAFPNLDSAGSADEVIQLVMTAPSKIDGMFSSLKMALEAYPYQVDFSAIGVDRSMNRSVQANAGAGSPPTLWESFLNDLLRQRHGIAHGSENGCEKDVPEVYLQKNKAMALLLLLSALLCGEAGLPEGRQ